MLLENFDKFEKEVGCVLEEGLVYFVYDYVFKCLYIFNLFDVCGVVFVIECVGYIVCICNLVCVVVKIFVVEWKCLGYLFLDEVIWVKFLVEDVE